LEIAGLLELGEPMALGPRTATAKGRLVVAHRRPIDPAKVEECRRDLNAAKLADYTEKILATWPPLTDQQIENVVAILRAGQGDAA
jgi:hypothetical protein